MPFVAEESACHILQVQRPSFASCSCCCCIVWGVLTKTKGRQPRLAILQSRVISVCSTYIYIYIWLQTQAIYARYFIQEMNHNWLNTDTFPQGFIVFVRGQLLTVCWCAEHAPAFADEQAWCLQPKGRRIGAFHWPWKTV